MKGRGNSLPAKDRTGVTRKNAKNAGLGAGGTGGSKNVREKGEKENRREGRLKIPRSCPDKKLLHGKVKNDEQKKKKNATVGGSLG